MAEFGANLPGAVAVRGSILSSGFDDESFDAVFVTGGLHHVHPRVPEAVAEIHRILKPGGWFCFYEPHTGSLADTARRFWYRHDSRFEDNEAAVDLEDLMRRNRQNFDFVTTRYSGGPASCWFLTRWCFGCRCPGRRGTRAPCCGSNAGWS